jgi:hypothetical protein
MVAYSDAAARAAPDNSIFVGGHGVGGVGRTDRSLARVAIQVVRGRVRPALPFLFIRTLPRLRWLPSGVREDSESVPS